MTYMQAILAFLLGLAGFVVPTYVLMADRDLIVPVVFVFATIGFVLVILGIVLVGRSRLQRRRAVAGGQAADKEEMGALLRSTFGWVWVAVGLVLIAFQLAVILVGLLVPGD